MGIFAPPRVLDDDAAAARKGLTVASIASREDAIEHVDAEADGKDEVTRCANAHQVSRSLGVEQWCRLAQRLVHLVDGLADGKASQRQTIERHRAKFLGVVPAQIREASALHDAEKGLLLGSCRCKRSPGPAGSPSHGAFDDLPPYLAGRTHIELHLDVGAKETLHGDCSFGSQ